MENKQPNNFELVVHTNGSKFLFNDDLSQLQCDVSQPLSLETKYHNAKYHCDISQKTWRAKFQWTLTGATTSRPHQRVLRLCVLKYLQAEAQLCRLSTLSSCSSPSRCCHVSELLLLKIHRAPRLPSSGSKLRQKYCSVFTRSQRFCVFADIYEEVSV